MSRRGAGNNNVRGPSSALTSFLRDQGIDTRAVNTWTRRIEEENNDEGDGAAGPSTVRSSASATPNRRQASGADTGYNSDDLDRDDADSKETPSAKGKKKPTKAQLEKEKAKAKAASDAKKRKRGDSDYNDDDDDEDDAYTAPSKATGKVKTPDIGSFENCAKCDKRFTVTKYTVPCNHPPGYLCHECAKAGGEDPFKKKATSPRKKRLPVDKRKVINFEEKEAVRGLAAMCIEIISEHIDDVEALGDIGAVNMNNISKIIAKNRKLTPENVLLFYDSQNTTLTLHDVTCIQPPALKTLASLNPNLTNLRLDFCGRMVDSVLEYYGTHLQQLSRIELLGPFLIRAEGWIHFFNAVGRRLQGFLIFQSPRFDLSCLEALVNNTSISLTELRLAEVGQLNDEWLTQIASLNNLTFLDLSYPSQSLSDDAVINALAIIGPKLRDLNLSGNIALTDKVLEEGVGLHGPIINTLAMADLELLTDKGVAEFFTVYKAPLVHINFSRNQDLSSESLLALLSNHGALRHLNINSWKGTSSEALFKIATASALEWIDFGWCRAVDDFVIKALMDGCKDLSVVKCFGCNLVSERCPKRRGVSIFGVESHVAQ